jgi:hypothetical protein
MKIRAKYPRGTCEYYDEPYSLQHFANWFGRLFIDIPSFVWFAFRHMTSRKFRVEVAGTYNRAMFGNIPTSQMYVMDDKAGVFRKMREDERTWPE